MPSKENCFAVCEFSAHNLNIYFSGLTSHGEDPKKSLAVEVAGRIFTFPIDLLFPSCIKKKRIILSL